MSNTQFLTCVFKIHNPSVHKKKVMDNALLEYTIAYQSLLDYAQANYEHIKKEGVFRSYSRKTGELLSEKYTGKSIGALLPRVKANVHSSIKDSLIQDVAGNLASYFELVKDDERTSFPQGRNPFKEIDDNALDNFIKCGASIDDYNQSRDRYLHNSKISYMPLFFCGADGATKNRKFSLLMDTRQKRWFAVLYLLPAGHELGKSLGAKEGNLVRIDTGDVFISNSKCAILVPLEVGGNGWQEHKFLEVAQNGYASVKTAYLVKSNNEYFLHIAFEFECAERYEPESYLGIDRGVFFSMAYAIVDKEGKIIKMVAKDDGFRGHVISSSKRVAHKQAQGKKVTAADYKRRESEHLLHAFINDIINEAIAHKSMIVMEDLNIRIKGKFYKSAWQKIYHILEYKCKLTGVPLYKNGIWAAYSSQICIYCGALNKGRKRDGSPFVCPHCSASYNSDAGAGVNIARRVLYRKKEWEKRGGYIAFHKSFCDDLTVFQDMVKYKQLSFSQT